MMDPTIKAEWVSDLRSGEYLQVKGALRAVIEDTDSMDQGQVGHCCLGVLMDGLSKRHPEILAAAGVVWGVDTNRPNERSWGATIPGHEMVTSLLPIAVGERIGLDYENRGIDSGSPVVTLEIGAPASLHVLNDSRVPFTRIADLIEAQL